MKSSLHIMRRALPMRTAYCTSDWWSARQIGAAVAAVEDEVYRPLGGRCGGEDGEVRLGVDVLWGERGVFFGAPGGVAHDIDAED